MKSGKQSCALLSDRVTSLSNILFTMTCHVQDQRLLTPKEGQEPEKHQLKSTPVSLASLSSSDGTGDPTRSLHMLDKQSTTELQPRPFSLSSNLESSISSDYECTQKLSICGTLALLLSKIPIFSYLRTVTERLTTFMCHNYKLILVIRTAARCC